MSYKQQYHLIATANLTNRSSKSDYTTGPRIVSNLFGAFPYPIFFFFFACTHTISGFLLFLRSDNILLIFISSVSCLVGFLRNVFQVKLNYIIIVLYSNNNNSNKKQQRYLTAMCACFVPDNVVSAKWVIPLVRMLLLFPLCRLEK